MMTYIFALLGMVALCVFWAVFQLWLNRHHPDNEKRPIKCAGCDENCEE